MFMYVIAGAYGAESCEILLDLELEIVVSCLM